MTASSGLSSTRGRISLIICAVLGPGTWVCFWPAASAQFLNYDDNEYVTNNPIVLGGLSWRGVTWAFVTNHACNWHPLTWLSHMLDVSLFGTNPAGPHCVNIFLHSVNAVLLFVLLTRLTGRLWPSVVVAALFAWHPLHVESVAWVAERKDVLSTFFGLLSLIAYAKWARARISPLSRMNPPSQKTYLLSLACFALGLMSKPMLVTLPFVMLLLDFWPFGRVAGREVQTPKPVGLSAPTISVYGLVWEKMPFILLSAGACAATIWAQKGAIQPLEHLPLADRIGNALISYTRYLWKTIVPVDLALPYLHPGHWPAGEVWGAVAILAGLSAFAVLAAGRKPYLLMGWLWFLGTLIPVIGIVQVGTQAIADRYTYFPLIGPFIAVVWGLKDVLYRLRSPKFVPAIATIVALGFCGVLTFRQASFWRDSETLFKHADAVTSNNFIAVANVGGVLFEQGHLEEAMEWYRRSYEMNPKYVEAVNSIGAVLAAKGSDEAILWFQKALEIQPNHPQALFNTGNAMVRKGDTAGAVAYFQAAVRAKPDNYEARNNLGNALFKLRRVDEAITQYEAALHDQPQAALIQKNLGEALAAKGRFQEAIAQYRHALELTNDAATHYSLGMTFAVQKKWDSAIEQYNATLLLCPTNAEAHYNLGYALAVNGRPSEAETQYIAAIAIRSEFPIAHYNLGCVLAEQGKRDEAIGHLRKALEQQPDYKEASEKLSSLEAGK